MKNLSKIVAIACGCMVVCAGDVNSSTSKEGITHDGPAGFSVGFEELSKFVDIKKLAALEDEGQENAPLYYEFMNVMRDNKDLVACAKTISNDKKLGEFLREIGEHQPIPGEVMQSFSCLTAFAKLLPRTIFMLVGLTKGLNCEKYEKKLLEDKNKELLQQLEGVDSKQTFARIEELEKQIERMTAEKDREIEALSKQLQSLTIENADLASENAGLKERADLAVAYSEAAKALAEGFTQDIERIKKEEK